MSLLCVYDLVVSTSNSIESVAAQLEAQAASAGSIGRYLDFSDQEIDALYSQAEINALQSQEELNTIFELILSDHLWPKNISNINYCNRLEFNSSLLAITPVAISHL